MMSDIPNRFKKNLLRYKASVKRKISFQNRWYHDFYDNKGIHNNSMNRTEIKNILDGLSKAINSISDEQVKSVQQTLFNLVETLLLDNDELQKVNQQLRDEINRLKGERNCSPHLTINFTG